MTDIELIKSKLDIADVVSSYVKDLKKAGANYKAPCPFHKEKTPSFTVNPSLQIFKCFGCGKAGDVIKFIEEIERVDFPQALEIAAEKAGVQLKGEFKPDNKTVQERKRLIEANTLTAKFYNYILSSHTSGKAGRDYAQKRKIDSERIAQFLIGYATSSRENLKKFLTSRGFTEKELVVWGLLVERNRKTIDKFRQRLMQPIFNLKGEIVGFSGRFVGTSKDAPKYLNSPETLVYKKNELLYGLYQAKDHINDNKDKFGFSFIILVEGNIDIVSSHRVGIGNIVAPLGTAFTLNQAKLIKRFADEVYFCFDTDTAGIKALIRSMGIAEDIELRHKVIDLGSFQDADELICKGENGEWEKRIQNPKNTFEYIVEKFSADLDLGSADGKSVFETRILPVLALLKNEVEYNHFRNLVATILGVSEDYIHKKIQKFRGVKTSTVGEEEKPGHISVELKDLPQKEKYLLELIVGSDLIHRIDFSKFLPEYFSDERCRVIYKALSQSANSTDFSEIEKKLPESLHSIFESIVLYEPSNIKDVVKEVNKIAAKIYKQYLISENKNINGLMMLDSDNSDLLQKTDHIAKEIRKLDNEEFNII